MTVNKDLADLATESVLDGLAATQQPDFPEDRWTWQQFADRLMETAERTDALSKEELRAFGWLLGDIAVQLGLALAESRGHAHVDNLVRNWEGRGWETTVVVQRRGVAVESRQASQFTEPPF